MKGFLLLGFFVAAFGFTLRDFRFNNAGNAIAGAFDASAKELLSFDPIEAAKGYKLQDAAACQAAWLNLAGMLQNQTDSCNIVLLIVQGLQDPKWSDGAVAYYLNGFCNADGGACYKKYNTSYNNMLAACSTFEPSQVAPAFGNETDRLARTIKALINVPCKANNVAYNAPNFTDPIFGNDMPAIAYPFTFCWLHFKWLLSINLDTVQDSDLTAKCTDCAHQVTDWLTKNGVNQLALAARQARAFCDKKHDPETGDPVYCATMLKAFRAAAADPAFMDTIRQNTTAGMAGLRTFCHPCVRWGMRLALEIQDLFQIYNSSGFNETIRDQLVQAVNGLSVSCVRDLRNDYCVNLLYKYDINALTTRFAPCIKTFGCAGSPDCKPAILSFYREVGCCLSVFLRSLKFLTGSAAGAAAAVPPILESCGFVGNIVPDTCAQRKVNFYLPLNNVAYAFIQNQKQADLAQWFASSLGVDIAMIRANGINCYEADPVKHTAACNITVYPDDSATADAIVADFTYNIQNGLQYQPELDIASLQTSAAAGGCRVDEDADAYQASSFTAEAVTDCFDFQSPVKSTPGPNGTCVPICENGVKDGDESDVDCGGVGCGPCQKTEMCNTNADCATPLTCENSCEKTCTKRCTSGVAALLANPLLLLVGAFLALFLL